MRRLTFGNFDQTVYDHYYGANRKPIRDFSRMLLMACGGVEDGPLVSADDIDEDEDIPKKRRGLFPTSNRAWSAIRHNKEALSSDIIRLYTFSNVEYKVEDYFSETLTPFLHERETLHSKIVGLVQDDRPDGETEVEYTEKTANLLEYSKYIEDLNIFLANIFVYCVLHSDKRSLGIIDQNKVKLTSAEANVTKIDSYIGIQVRKYGNSEWLDEIDAFVGDEIECQIHFKNLGCDPVSNVMVSVSLPRNMRLYPGSSKLYNTAFPHGATTINDSLDDTGENIGHYAVNGDGYLRFKVRVSDICLVEGINRLIIWSKVSTGNSVGLSTASVYVKKLF